ncbi:hypothetical protein EXIGLDRAFT_768983 [Exidia glandulosa HHB12029]|uniref:BTB domain-containing protein n=1 Tax=Exidia glandulosa HHB12029 TaxID=1314781 RepID=A0A165HT95_EXIGL|nr:hypothetical protein EXIGLDRAFT_768983 [Exidia glandulosa HHB12029]
MDDLERLNAPPPKSLHNTVQESSTAPDAQPTADNINFDDSIVCIRVGPKSFRVAKSRLARRSPVFSALFTLPQPDSAERAEVVLHNDPDDFEHFLWFVHADAIDLEDLEDAPQNTKLTRYLGIATIARMYDATAVERWALAKVADNLKGVTVFYPRILAKMLHFTIAVDGDDTHRSIVKQLRDDVHRALYRLAHISTVREEFNTDLADMVTVLDEAGDTDLLANVYYYLLVYRSDTWAKDETLRPIDRLRILCGSHALREAGILKGAGSDRETYVADRTMDVRLKRHRSDMGAAFDPAPWRLPWNCD